MVTSRATDRLFLLLQAKAKALSANEKGRPPCTIPKPLTISFRIVHGGLPFSLADSAFAFACNNRNNLSVALDVTITFMKAVNVGDVLTAEAKEIHNGRSTGVY